jgi:hypothetical protein
MDEATLIAELERQLGPKAPVVPSVKPGPQKPIEGTPEWEDYYRTKLRIEREERAPSTTARTPGAFTANQLLGHLTRDYALEDEAGNLLGYFDPETGARVSFDDLIRMAEEGTSPGAGIPKVPLAATRGSTAAVMGPEGRAGKTIPVAPGLTVTAPSGEPLAPLGGAGTRREPADTAKVATRPRPLVPPLGISEGRPERPSAPATPDRIEGAVQRVRGRLDLPKEQHMFGLRLAGFNEADILTILGRAGIR